MTQPWNDELEPSAVIEILRPGKDEMNLVEYPFAALRREEGALPVIEFEWENHHPLTRKSVKASWRVEGSPKMGLPTSTDERVYLVLMELSREAGFYSPTVHFSCYDLLQRLGWDDGQKSYTLLRDALERLTSVTIITRNAFWNHAHKSFVNTGFNLIEVYEILAEKPGRKKSSQALEQRDLPTSYFKWSEVIFTSMQAGYLKTLDLDFALSLQGSISVRLYRYLDKKSYDARRTFEIELAALCERHLGMRPNPYPSKLKERLKPAHDELLARGFLKSVRFEPMKSKKGEKVRYEFAPRPTSAPQPETAANISTPAQLLSPPAPIASTPPTQLISENTQLQFSDLPDEPTAPVEAAPQPRTEIAPEVAPEVLAIIERMLGIGVSRPVAEELARGVALKQLEIQLDSLPDREPKNPAATFVKAVREVWALPPNFVSRLEAQERAEKAKMDKLLIEAEDAAKGALKRQQRASQDEETARLDAAYAKLDERNRKRIDDEATNRLGIIGRLGKNEGALKAMRRNVLREMLSQVEHA